MKERKGLLSLQKTIGLGLETTAVVALARVPMRSAEGELKQPDDQKLGELRVSALLWRS